MFYLFFRFQHTDEEVERCYEEFYEDVHTEFLKFGEIVNFKVVEGFLCFRIPICVFNMFAPLMWDINSI